MAEVLELAQLAQDDAMAQMEVGTRGVAAELQAQRDARFCRALELGHEFGLGHDLDGAAADGVEGGGNG